MEEGVVKNNLLIGLAAVVCPLVLNADTLVMKDGSRYTGTFISGNSRNITFRTDNGTRRTYNIANVQELAFGDSLIGSTNDPAPRQYTDMERAEMLNRLRADVQTAINNGNLTARERRSADDALATLRDAAENRRDGYSVDSREVRLAMDNLRTLLDSNSIRPEDRDRLREDLNQLRAMRRADDTGVRSRTR
jgi:hypothetical protein